MMNLKYLHFLKKFSVSTVLREVAGVRAGNHLLSSHIQFVQQLIITQLH